METIMTAPLGGQSSSGSDHMVMGGYAVKGRSATIHKPNGDIGWFLPANAMIVVQFSRQDRLASGH
jgi:hypothetical protein